MGPDHTTSRPHLTNWRMPDIPLSQDLRWNKIDKRQVSLFTTSQANLKIFVFRFVLQINCIVFARTLKKLDGKQRPHLFNIATKYRFVVNK